MQNQTHITAQAIRYIEGHLNGKLELETVAAALHYSKFYLHRCFTKTVGLTVHDYVQRRQLASIDPGGKVFGLFEKTNLGDCPNERL